MSLDIVIALSLLLIGFLYSSVGHGGASGYIAVLSLFAVPVDTYKPMILILNIVVAGVAFYQFRKAGFFKWEICRPFLFTSVPAAFIGSRFPLQGELYNLLLGLALVVPIIKLLGVIPSDSEHKRVIPVVAPLIWGAVLGLLSGMLNIGGGIFLSPVLILLSWANAKEAAAASALFIVLNSLGGLLGSSDPISISPSAAVWFSSAAAGGFLGSYIGSQRLPQVTIRYLLTAVLAIASCKLIFFM
ncbi:hypothetical protein B0I27_107179 [Arcticibacter pallidicorallinus]|uniref:Probable membrane transporter protein n=1 Tax=Arcticibacter pallidicorallinus TaxID=1259464 RepID=A0A2T0U0Z7_9SPHI|nr:sulfite exporter TauE/SafE family protein [Arcticibacter pallidicorallinus]PRY51591.1 hypothetical protein B0I27_107179 [Arcticibacter pallidicorallinus]